MERRPRLIAMLLALTLAGAVALGGCSRKPDRARSAAGGSDGFPVTVRDAQGTAVTVAQRPRRIASLAPTVTEILFAIGAGDRVVAVAEPADYPPEAARRPRLGGWFTPSAEKTLAAEPDLVVASRGNPPEFLATLRKSGCVVFAVDPRSLEAITTTIRDIGRLVGAQEGAERAVARMREHLDSVARRIGDVPDSRRPTAFLIVGINPVWTAGSETFQDDALRAAGAHNVGADRAGFHPFGTESLLAADPDYLVVSTMEGAPDRMKQQVLADPALRRLTAAREGRIVVLEANHIMRPGPRLVYAVEAMARAFYPDRFAESRKQLTHTGRGSADP